MFLIDDYIEKINEKNGLVMYISKHEMLSPCCQADQYVFSYRKRTYIDDQSMKKEIYVRRFRCSKCKKTHTELPSFLHPYRRYVSETIEQCIDETDINKCPVQESSTAYKIKKAFRYWGRYWLDALYAIRARFSSPASDPTLEDIPILEMSAIRAKKGWLCRVVRVLANFNFGRYTRLACTFPPA